LAHNHLYTSCFYLFIYIVGGSTGLGLGTAIAYAKAGAKVSIVARDLKKLDDAKKEIEAARKHQKDPVFIYSCDVTDFEKTKKAIEEANKFHGTVVNHLICAAGLCVPGYFIEQDVSIFRKMMDLNYFGVLHTIKAAAPSMIAAKNGGNITIVSSGAALLSFIGFSQYCPSKYALRGLAESLRNEFKLYDIKVNIFYPGNIDSPGFIEENKIKPEETKTIEGVSFPMSPESVAKSMIQGIKDGEFAITNDPLIFILRTLANGIAPRYNSPLEILVLPLCVLIQMGFGLFMDVVVLMSKKNRVNKEKMN
jgi:NAD(P)-dependent dehydrogenase (short-subunit alcohol dehydrogenase family)